MSAKRKGGNPANRSSGRVTPKGTVPKTPGAGKVRDAAHRARVSGRRTPRTSALVDRRALNVMSPAKAQALLGGLLAALERAHPDVSEPDAKVGP